MNDTRAGLEAALAANPDDLATHAAYADCLSELGDPRGDYVRLQLALEDRNQPAERLRAMEQEVFELRQRHEAEWLGPLAPHVAPTAGVEWKDVNIEVLEANVQVTYRRGWIDQLRVLRLTESVGVAIAGCSITRLASELFVESGRTTALVLMSLPNLTRLTCQETPGDQPSDELAGGNWFHPLRLVIWSVPRSLTHETVPRLRYLTLRSSAVEDEGVEHLILSGLLDRLRGLDLCNCAISDDGALALAAHPAVPGLEYLHLDGNHISPIGIDALAAVGVTISQRQYLGPLPGGEFGDDPDEIPF